MERIDNRTRHQNYSDLLASRERLLTRNDIETLSYDELYRRVHIERRVGYQRGHSDGCQDAYTAGMCTDGEAKMELCRMVHADGYQNGHADGCMDGWNAGYASGCENGYQDGINKSGFNIGMAAKIEYEKQDIYKRGHADGCYDGYTAGWDDGNLITTNNLYPFAESCNHCQAAESAQRADMQKRDIVN